MSQYTPGPWMSHGQHVITGNDAGPIDARSVADARLIAASPELLAAAGALLAKLDTMTTEEFRRGEEKVEREALRAAIRKATGG